MKAEKVSIRYVPIDSLKENPDNAREHGSEIEELVQSVGRFGFAGEIKVDKDMNIIAGHGRLIAAKRNGMKEVPVMVLPFDREEAMAFALLDNKTSDDSSWIMDRYERQVKELSSKGWDMGSFGFTLPDFGEFAPAPVEEPLPEPLPITDTPDQPQRENFNVMVYCEDKATRDRVLAFLLENDIPGQVLG